MSDATMTTHSPELSALPITPLPDSEQKKLWTFRRLKAVDLFPLAHLLSKIGINRFMDAFGADSVQKVIAGLSDQDSTDDSGDIIAVGGAAFLSILQVILENLDKCENELYQLLSSTSDLTIPQIRDMDMDVFLDMVIDFIQKEEFKDFFKRASALLK